MNAEYIISSSSIMSKFTLMIPNMELTLRQEYWINFCIWLVTVVFLSDY